MADEDHKTVKAPECSSLLVGVEIDTSCWAKAGQDGRKLDLQIYSSWPSYFLVRPQGKRELVSTKRHRIIVFNNSTNWKQPQYLSIVK